MLNTMIFILNPFDNYNKNYVAYKNRPHPLGHMSRMFPYPFIGFTLKIVFVSKFSFLNIEKKNTV